MALRPHLAQQDTGGRWRRSSGLPACLSTMKGVLLCPLLLSPLVAQYVGPRATCFLWAVCHLGPCVLAHPSLTPQGLGGCLMGGHSWPCCCVPWTLSLSTLPSGRGQRSEGSCVGVESPRTLEPWLALPPAALVLASWRQLVGPRASHVSTAHRARRTDWGRSATHPQGLRSPVEGAGEGCRKPADLWVAQEANKSCQA